MSKEHWNSNCEILHQTLLSIAFYSKNQGKVKNTLVSFSNQVINYHYIKIPETKFASGYKLLIGFYL